MTIVFFFFFFLVLTIFCFKSNNKEVTRSVNEPNVCVCVCVLSFYVQSREIPTTPVAGVASKERR